jgi:hypothetical protein
MTNTTVVDLPVDLNSEDDTGLPWGFLDESRNPCKITEGAWIYRRVCSDPGCGPGRGHLGGIVHARRPPGSVESHRNLLGSMA